MRTTSTYLLALSMTLALSSNVANAQGAKAAPAPAKKAEAKGEDKKVDISDLENKYWAPKDTDFSVVQNRTYTKEGRWFITPQFGLLVNDSYSSGTVFGLTGNYFFSERYGVQLSYQKSNLKNNTATNALATNYSTGVYPDHDRLNSFYGAGFSYVPFYAKMSFMGKKILYFDMAITPVIGMTNYDQMRFSGDQGKSAFTYGFDITQYFFFNNWFAIRADLTNHWSSQNVVKYYKDTPHNLLEGDPAGTKSNLDTTFLMGLTFYY